MTDLCPGGATTGPIDRNGAATCDFMRMISILFKHKSEIFKDESDCFEVFKDIQILLS